MMCLSVVTSRDPPGPSSENAIPDTGADGSDPTPTPTPTPTPNTAPDAVLHVALIELIFVSVPVSTASLSGSHTSPPPSLSAVAATLASALTAVVAVRGLEGSGVYGVRGRQMGNRVCGESGGGGGKGKVSSIRACCKAFSGVCDVVGFSNLSSPPCFSPCPSPCAGL